MLKNPPEGYHNLTPQTVVEDAHATIDFLVDVFGADINQWWISTHFEDVSEGEIRRRMAETGG